MHLRVLLRFLLFEINGKKIGMQTAYAIEETL